MEGCVFKGEMRFCDWCLKHYESDVYLTFRFHSSFGILFEVVQVLGSKFFTLLSSASGIADPLVLYSEVLRLTGPLILRKQCYLFCSGATSTTYLNYTVSFVSYF